MNIDFKPNPGNSNRSADIACETGECDSRPVRAAIYARVSSPNQKFNSSIREQIAHCRRYISQKGWATRHIFLNEESGKTIDRPKFQLMLEKARRIETNVDGIGQDIDELDKHLRRALNELQTRINNAIKQIGPTKYNELSPKLAKTVEVAINDR